MTDAGAAVTTPHPSTSRLAGALLAFPDRVLAFALCAILATTVPLQLNAFHPYTVFPLFLFLVLATWRVVPNRFGTGGPAARARQVGTRPQAAAIERSSWIPVVIVVVLVLGWMFVQRHYISELLSVRRDPAIYTLRGIWLMNHSSPDVTLTQQVLDINRAVPQAGLDFGLETGRSTRYFQSTTIVPGLIAIAGWIGGIPLLLQADVFVGGIALICVYAVGRRMAGPVFGLVPVIALASCQPLLAFTRVAYTEPLSIIAVMACLLGLWEAVRTHRPAMWLLAGVGAGGVVICRIDGWVVVIGAFVGIGIWGGAASSQLLRRKILAGYGWFCLAVFPVGALGVTDLVFHSPDYLRALQSTWKLMALGVPTVAVTAVLVIVVPGMPEVAGWLRRRPVAISRVVVVLVGVAMLLVLTRPLYLHMHLVVDAAGQAANITRQQAEGLPIDPTRSYDEQSLVWISWYLGWPTVILACLAGLLAVRAAVRRRSPAIVVVMSVVAVNAALYLNDVSITPDQIWAMRRFLPVILPGGLLMVAWGLREVYERRRGLAGRLVPGLGPAGRTQAMGVVVGAVGALVVLYPLTTVGAITRVSEGAGQYDLVEKTCAHIRGQKVLIVGNIPQMGFYQPTFRNICDSSVITVPASDLPTEQRQIARILSLWGSGPVKVVSFYAVNVPWSTTPAGPSFRDTYRMWESVLAHRPVRPTIETTQVWLGTAQPNGLVVPE